MYLLDTNIISAFYRGNDKLKSNLEHIDEVELVSCSVVFAELYFGLENLSYSTKKLDLEKFFHDFESKIEIFDFDIQAANYFAQIKKHLKSMGRVSEDVDIMIAAICLANNLILVTNNTKHFEKIHGLKIEDWLA